MPVAAQVPYNNAIANGTTTVFPFSFLVLLSTDLVVKVAGVTKTLGVDYTVAGLGNPAGGTVTFLVAPLNALLVTIYRSTALVRTTDYQTNGDFLADTVDADFDRLWMAQQELALGPTGFGRVVRAPSGEVLAEMPAAASRANNILTFDSSGNPIVVAPVSGSATSLATDLMNAALAGKGAGQVAFNGALNYAVGTIGRQLLSGVSIDSFAGIDPTGALDSSASMTTAIGVAAALGVKRLIFPGTYKLNSTVNLASGIEYVFLGTFNLNVAEIGFLIPAAGSKITIDGCGTGTIQGTCSRAIASVNASTCSDIRVRGLNITGCTLQGAGYTSAIFLDGVTRCWIEENRCYGNGYGAIAANVSGDIIVWVTQNAYVNVFRNVCLSTAVAANLSVYNATDVHIDFNTCSGAVTGSGNNNGYAILLYSSIALACKRATITGNGAQNTGGSAIYCVDVTDLTVAANELFNVAQTQSDVGLPVGGVALNGCTNAVASANITDTSGKAGVTTTGGTRIIISGGSSTNCSGPGYYIRGTGDYGQLVGVNAENCAAGVYSDSTSRTGWVIDAAVKGSKTGTRGVDLQNISGSTIRGTATSNARDGLAVLAGADNVITGFVALNNGTDAANTYDGITVGSTGTKIVGCRSGNTAATGQRYGVNSTGNYNDIENNNLTRNQTDGYNLAGTNFKRNGNRLSKTATPGPIQGSFVLVAGTVAGGVATDEARTGDVVEFFCVTAGGTQGIVRTASIVNETSFTPTSSQAADTSTYGYRINH